MSERLAAWRRWQAAAGPWQNWSICPALLSPEPCTPRTLPMPALVERLVPELETLLADEGSLVLLDLDPVVGVEVAARLTHRAHPVLVLPRWPYEQAILPTGPLLGSLLARSLELPRDADRRPNVVFVADGERSLLVPDRTLRDRRADNRHTLAVIDLPNLATLRRRAIRRVVKVTRA
jgi:hypothetical protein